MEFPKIDYKHWFNQWTLDVGGASVYSNKNLTKYIRFDGNINSCTSEIFTLVKATEITKANILRVVDLIYSWGGPSGRMFYASKKGEIAPRESLENDDSVFSIYMNAIQLAKQGKEESINEFCKIAGIGRSFGSKHAYFWSLDSKNPLIIIDSKIAGALGYSTIESLDKAHKYGEIVSKFRTLALEKFNEDDPSKIERALFAFHNYYFLNDNSGWKNEVSGHNFPEANALSAKLFSY